jgi:hypothetical protein
MNSVSAVKFEYWNTGSRNSFIYTECREIAKDMLKDFGGTTVYFKRGLPFAWQWLVPSRVVPILMRRIQARDRRRSSSGSEIAKNLGVDFQ